MYGKLAVIYSGFMKDYLKDFLDICFERGILTDVFFYNNENFNHKVIRKKYYLKSKLKPKSFNSKRKFEKEINETADLKQYDYILMDSIPLSFTCNIIHNLSLNFRINSEDNIIAKKILALAHLKRLITEKKYYKNSPKLIAVSNLVKNDLIKNWGIDENRIDIIYPGTNCDVETVKTTNKQENKFIIGAVTCGFTTKGGYNVIGGIKELVSKKLPVDIEVRIINPKADKQIFLKLYLKLLGIEKYIKFYPYQKDIKQFYSELNCLICASKFEAFGRIVTEAMIRKVPIILGSNIGAAEIIQDGVNGFVFKADKNKYKNLANKIEEVIFKSKDIPYLTDNAFNTAIKYSWQNFAHNLFYSLYPVKNINN